MLKLAVGQSDELDAELVADEILGQCEAALGGLVPQAGLLLASHDVELEPLLGRIHDAHAKLQLTGCTTVAPMCSAAAYAEGATMLTLFASDVLDFTTGLGAGVSAAPGVAARAAVAEARAKTDKRPTLCVVTSSVDGLDPAMLTAELRSQVGDDCCLFGGGAHPVISREMPWSGSAQIYGNRVLTDALPVMLISGNLHVSVGVGHGWNPVGKSGVVTRAEGAVVYEIDDLPVLDFYARYIGSQTGPALSIPLAILDEDSGRSYLRTAMRHDDETRAVTFLGSVPEGATVRIAMASNDEILDGARASAQEAVATFPGPRKPEAALVASCTVRNILLGTRAGSELEQIKGAVGDIPVSGFYAFGEIAPLGGVPGAKFHNETCVTVLIGT